MKIQAHTNCESWSGGIDKTNGLFEIVYIYEEQQKCVESYYIPALLDGAL